MGLYWEEFEVGQGVLTAARTVTEADVVQFAGMTGDNNPLHTDEEFAKQTQFGTRIAHGLLGLAIGAGLKARTGMLEGTAIAFLSLNNWAFKAPIRIGDTIRVRVTVTEKRETSKPERGILIQHLEVLNQRDEVCQEGDHTLLVRRRPQG